ncbi:MAG: phosphodiester glycosidase family protein [Bacteroidales bacterium]
MKRSCLPLFILLSIVFMPDLSGQNYKFKVGKWEREKIAPGLVYKHAHSRVTDTLMQNINVLVINTRRRPVSLVYNPSLNSPVSKQAAAAGALAAANAGFFNIKDGGSATYIKVDGRIVDSDTASKWKRSPNMNGTLMIDREGRVHIGPSRTNQWYDSHPEFDDVLVTGCLLLLDGRPAKLPESSLVVTRHPRTCIGTSGSRKVIIVTIDGRTAESAGMNLPMLAGFMKFLKCNDAVNLDGGGSTTLWIRNKPWDGVVNMPCDNKKFDHEGARAVSDIICVW